ncbi:Oidioi.mRNA.OKI2018_I69.PAR.g13145.t1.cds [Oikopleura dioica]|uniref:Oidioi.mRNA.OKI2018_I69.PAR.g13145.t1.cds n=1 Tax=Oikopleura dioica TaxID=34765 RepID=A0ABN7SB75_OIKDI|nr:Oidioi.mRNA.OKI2018_I69.PAR.g13145.t1.cds [Oikopleura dioica]
MNMNLALDDLEKDIALLQGLILRDTPKQQKQQKPQPKKTFPQVENIEDNLAIAIKQAEVDKIELEILRNELEQQELLETANSRHDRLVQSMMNQVQHLDEDFVLDILKLLEKPLSHGAQTRITKKLQEIAREEIENQMKQALENSDTSESDADLLEEDREDVADLPEF